jgi:uncharacterized protein YggE
MFGRKLAVVTAVAALALVAPALAATTGQTITATGTSQVKVKPKNRHSNASIAAAEAAAHKAGVPLAIADAKTEAKEYAAAAGLTLGPLVSISDVVSNNGPFYVGAAQQGPFGPGKYCGVLRVPVFKKSPAKVPGKGVTLKVVRTKKEHRCEVPSPVTTTLAVTYSAS